MQRNVTLIHFQPFTWQISCKDEGFFGLSLLSIR